MVNSENLHPESYNKKQKQELNNHGIDAMNGGKIEESSIAGNIENNSNQHIDAEQVTINQPSSEIIKITKTKTVKIGNQEETETTSMEVPVSLFTEDLKEFFQTIAGDAVKIEDADLGSIKLTISSSKEGLNKIADSFKSNILADIVKRRFNLELENVELLDDDRSMILTIAGEVSENDLNILKKALARGSENKKNRLIENILTQGISKKNLRGADLRYADLRYAYLEEANLSGSYLKGANLIRAYLRYADLRYAHLEGANLSGSYLKGANLEDANLNDAKLEGAYLSGSYLKGANLSGADLRYAYLEDANLSGTNLSGVDLRYANLSDANLSDARGEKAVFGNNLGISESLKQDLIAKGAIFNDAPGDRSSVPTRS